MCDATKDDFMRLDHWDAISSPFTQRTWEDYTASCDGCEIWVTMSRTQHLTVRGLLFYDKRKHSKGRGLVLRDGYAPLGLEKGDRLEPHSGLPNIEAFETISEFPVRVLLWRATSERMTHHRNPLFNPENWHHPEPNLRIGLVTHLVARLLPDVVRFCNAPYVWS